MNYYEHHLGDWAAATGHLSWDEDMAYTRLLRAYYHHEKAIADGQQYRLSKAATPAQRKAVDQVLVEFFELREGHYHQNRADKEIARYLDKQRKAKSSAETRWKHTERNAKASPNAMRTHSEGNALQTPDTRHQTPEPQNQTPPIPPEGGKRPGPVGLKAWLEAVKAAGGKAIPEADPVFAYAAEVGIPNELLSLAWQEFRHRYSQPDAKRYRDWRSVFRKAVRGNWLKLWYVGQDGAYGLTTVGHQAQRSHNERRAA